MKMQSLVKISDRYFIKETEAGYYPVLTYEMKRRVKNKEACVVVVCGEAGTGKSYLAIQLAKNVNKRFNENQIIFTYSDYVSELQRNKRGLPIVFDEPSYAMGKREWYKEINQALVKTIESQRFLVRPLIIPIINLNLLDKTLRDFLVIFQVYIVKRGRAMVYRLRASQNEDRCYRYFMCNLNYPNILDKCDKESCLDCGEIESCQDLRAKYERKKMTIQMIRYKQDEEQAKTKESKEYTNSQLLDMIEEYLPECRINGSIVATKLKSAFELKLEIHIGLNKAYTLKSLIEMRDKKES